MIDIDVEALIYASWLTKALGALLITGWSHHHDIIFKFHFGIINRSAQASQETWTYPKLLNFADVYGWILGCG